LIPLDLDAKISKAQLDASKKYARDLKKKTSSFISLGLQCELTIRDEGNQQEYYVEDLISQIINAEDPIVLLGGPGAGKSTLLLKIANLFSETKTLREKYIPILVRCGLNTCTKIKDQVHLNGFLDEEKEMLWESGRLCIIFDGINEISHMPIGDFLMEVLQLAEKYPCKYILSCRTVEFPRFADKFFAKYSVMPVTDQQMETKLKGELGEEFGSIYYNNLIHGSQNYLIDICRNPLLLSLVSKIIKEKRLENGEFDLSQLRTKGDVYKHFCKLLIDHQVSKKDDPSYVRFRTLREELIKTLAYYMQARNQVYIDDEALLKIIRNMRYFEDRSKDLIQNLQTHKSDELWYQLIKDDLKKSSFFNGYAEAGTEYFAFIHQSFQEYFAGVYLSVHAEEPKYATYLLQNGDVKCDAIDSKQIKTRRNWATIEFAADLDESNRIIAQIMKFARDTEDSDALVLAAKCILGCEKVKGSTYMADDCCIWMLEAFKYWNLPYKYDLIYAANELLPFVKPDFPKRLTKDIKYFGEKYTGGYIASEYPESFDFDHLKAIITDGKYTYQLNAIYSLGERSWSTDCTDTIMQFLFSLLSNDDMGLREQVVKALKRLVENNKSVSFSNEQLGTLRRIVAEKKESARIRTYALNTVAEIGDRDAIPTVMAYLEDRSNPYRDSASWSLQEMVKDLKEPYTPEFIQSFYYKCLINESDDETGMYSKGNLVYTLSKLHSTAYVQRLKQWLKGESEPYVQEDGINAIGVLAGDNEIEFIREYINSPDPIIRSKAYRSLKDLGYLFTDDEIADMKSDSYSIVNSIYEDKMTVIQMDIDKILQLSSDNNCKPDIKQFYSGVSTVNNIIQGE